MIKSVNKRLSGWFGVTVLSAGVQVGREVSRLVPVSVRTPLRQAVTLTASSGIVWL